MKKSIFALVFAAQAALWVAAVSAQGMDTMAKIQSSGKVVMGTRESSTPIAYSLGDGKFVGYHVDICNAILKKIAPKAKVEYAAVTSANRIQLLQNGIVDIECGTTTNNEARQKDVAFANTTFLTEVRMAVKVNSGIKSIADLKDRNVATTTGTTSVALLRKHERANGVNFKEVYGKDHADSFMQLEAGRADAFVMDNNILAGLIANSARPADYAIVGEVLSTEPIGIMMRKDDPAFKGAVDTALGELIKDGMVEATYKKWFEGTIPPKQAKMNMPMSAGLQALLKAPNDKPAEAYNKK